MNVYLAGPDVFLPDAVEIGRIKADLCGRYGFKGLFPLDNQIDPSSGDASLQIFRGNADRVARIAEIKKRADGQMVDSGGLTVENFDQIDNLMIVHALEMHGYPIVKPQRAPSDIWHDLSSFEACLRLLAEHKIEGRALRLGR
jgi:nucleoside 2-deoxyribosyltransferase